MEGDTGNGQRGTKDNPLTKIPVLPNNLETITKPWLVRWAEWVKAGKPKVRPRDTLDFNPALHPRDPETGQFVERPFDIPDNVDTSNLADMSSAELLQEISNAGGDVESVLQDNSISIDGVGDDANSVDELTEETATTSSIGESVEFEGFEDEKQAEIEANLEDFAQSLIPQAGDKLRSGLKRVSGGSPSASPSGSEGSEIETFTSDIDIIQHEASHSLTHVYGMNGGIYPDENPPFSPPKHDFENAAVSERSALRDNTGVLFEEFAVPGIDEWRDDIEGATPDLSKNTFDSLNDETEAANRLVLEADENTLIRAPEPLPEDERFGNRNPEPHTYKVENVERFGPEGEDPIRAELTLKDASGKTYQINANRFEGNESVEAANENNPFMPTPDGIRSVPDGWNPQERTPNADDVLGSSDLEGDEALRNHFKSVNRAWYRQAVAAREYSGKGVSPMTLGDGFYSIETAGETIARLNEGITPQSNHSRAVAHALVNYHPDLLESTRQVRDFPDEFKELLNDELDRAGADFRFET